MNETTTEKLHIPGYDYGSPQSVRSPLPLEELWQLELTVGWSDEDAQVLRAMQSCSGIRPRPWSIPGER